MVARRWATTQSLTPKENVALLNAQRLQRPNSPHMTIYQPQVSCIERRVDCAVLSAQS